MADKNLYVIKTLDNRTVATGFATKQAAKAVRDKMTLEGGVYLVSRGPDHLKGSSQPDPYCRHVEQTGYKRQRRQRVSENQ